MTRGGLEEEDEDERASSPLLDVDVDEGQETFRGSGIANSGRPLSRSHSSSHVNPPCLPQETLEKVFYFERERENKKMRKPKKPKTKTSTDKRKKRSHLFVVSPPLHSQKPESFRIGYSHPLSWARSRSLLFFCEYWREERSREEEGEQEKKRR